MKLLVTDPISEEGLEMLRRDSEVQVDFRAGLSHEELVRTIGDYEGVIIRSGTEVNSEVIDAGKKLKVIGRAGVGVDNVDVTYATRRGILVMNTPAANIISAAEHTMAMMLTLARKIVWADSSLKSRKWERGKFTGIELSGKTLGIVGLGRVGSEVAKRAKSFQMRLIGYDPYIPPEKAVEAGVRLLPLERVLEESDIITIHSPLTSSTHHMIGEEELAMLRGSALVVNCARGGIIDEKALYESLKEEKIAGAALDVYEEEPPLESDLLGLNNIVTTPHLGASTKEAQEKVSLEMAEHVKLFLKENKITNAVNAPKERVDPKVAPFIPIAEKLGSFALQLLDGPINRVKVTCYGELASKETKILTVSALIGVLSRVTGEETNIINAEAIAKEKDIKVVESKVDESSHYINMISVGLQSDGEHREVRGTAFPSTEPRILGVDEFDIDMPLEGDFIMTIHDDLPGVIGSIGSILGDNDINIARMGVGRQKKGESALMLVSVDDPVEERILEAIEVEDKIREARYIRLSDIESREYLLE